MYRTGLAQYNRGEVSNASITKNRMTAMVKSVKVYHVDLEDSGNSLEYSCTCSASTFTYQFCPHVVAVLFYLKDHFGDLLEEEASRLDGIKYLMTHVRSKDMLKFLANYMSTHPRMKDRFVKQFSLENLHPPRDYAAQLDRMYIRARNQPDGRGSLDFGSLFTEARGRQERGEVPEATKMYRAISQVMRKNMRDFNDKVGYHADCCIEALENMVDSVVKENLPPKDKQFHIKDILDGFLELEEPRIMQYYRSAMDTLCTDVEDLAFLEDLLRPYLNDPNLVMPNADPPDSSSTTQKTSVTKTNTLGVPSSPPLYPLHESRIGTNKPPPRLPTHKLPNASEIYAARLAGVVWMQSHVLEETDRADEALKLLEKHAFSNKDLCVRYLHLLKDANSETASKKAQAVVEKFPKDRHVMDAALALIPKNSEYRVMLLKQLLNATADIDYADRLKECFLDWNASGIDDLLNTVKKVSPAKAVELCLNDSMYGKAMDMLESFELTGLYYEFYPKLVNKYPKRYVDSYNKALKKLLKKGKVEDHIEHTVKFLNRIKNTPDYDERYDKCVKHLTRKGVFKAHLDRLLKRK